MAGSFKPMKTGNDQDDSTFSSWTTNSIAQVQDKVQMISPAELEALKQQAQEEGYQQGIASANEEVAKISSTFSELSKKLEDAVLLIDKEVESELIELSIWIATQILNAELSINPQALLPILAEIKGLLPSANQMRALYFSKTDYDVISELKGSLPLDVDLESLQVDPNLSRGEFRIETVDSEVDATVNARVKELVLHTLETSNDE